LTVSATSTKKTGLTKLYLEIYSNPGGIPLHEFLISQKSSSDQNSEEKLSYSQKHSNTEIEEVPLINHLT
jgi:hypothetical protein